MLNWRMEKSHFQEFVLSLPINERAKVFETINYFIELKNQNLPIKESLSKYLEDGIFELRTAFARRIARSVYSERGKNYPDTWLYQENGENTTKGD